MPSERQMSELDLARILKQGQGPDLSRGVDLSKVAAKRKNAHRWVIHAFFEVGDANVAKLAERRLQLADLYAKELTDEAEAMPQVPLNMDQESLTHMDGPGCIKCGTHWEQPEQGWGQGCPVSDDEYAQAFMAQQAQQDMWLGGVFRDLVESARGTQRPPQG